MANPRATILADVLVEHYEELEFLWGQRQAALDDPAYLFRLFLDLEERVEAHVEGLLVGEAALGELLGAGLAAADPSAAFASAYPLLRTGRPEHASAVLDAFLSAAGGTLEGLGQALSHAPSAGALPVLREASRSAEAPRALAALEGLAFRSPGDCNAEGLAPFLGHEDPSFRLHCWRIVAKLKTPLIPARYRKALEDPDPLVRAAGFRAAAWGRQAWLPDHCRALLKSPKARDRDALHVLAVLGRPEDLPLFRDPRWAGTPSRGWFATLATFGHPGVIPDLVKGMEAPDFRLAVAAGAAFTRITGCAVASDRRVPLAPEDGSTPDDFEREFLDEVFLPDPAKARAFVKANKDALTKGARWHLGRELTSETARASLGEVDVPMRRDLCLRGRFEGRWAVGLADLERFPQRGVE